MDIFNLLATSNEVVPFVVERISSIDLNWIGKLISWLFDLFATVPGGVGIGAIVFTLCLKTLVLPLDIYSRVKTKKQALIMEKMRPQMEKLQKQYANDKTMYSQKVMELQKQNGYSMLGACLPMVVSLVIFMIVFSSFSTYANYALLSTYNDMVDAYNGSVQVYVMTDENDTDNEHFLLGADGNYFVVYDKFENYYAETHRGENPFTEDMTESEKNEIVASFVQINARAVSAKYYRDNKKTTSFLWIGNLWYPDSMFNKEVRSFSDFNKAVSRATGSGVSANYEESYNEVTFNLGIADPDAPNKKPETERYNGYFVLIVLAIGLMVLQQFISTRSQKATNELSSVDGSAAKTNKMMMIMMPLFYAIFSFLYSAAFSLYMITNTFYGLVSMLIINKAVTVRFAKKEEMQNLGKNNRPNNRKRLK